MIASHIKPYEYKNENNLCVGKYVLNLFTIQYIPNQDIPVKDAVHAGINVSTKYETPTWINFKGIIITIPYRTNLTDEAIQNIVNQYMFRAKLRNQTTR